MCFLPNRRASIDQAPGPIIAKAAAKIACARVTHGSPECEENSEIAIHTLAAAPSPPASGVNTPTNRSIAAAMPIICRATVNGGGPSRMPLTRCTISHSENRRFTKESTGLKLGWRDPPFGGSKLDDSAFQRGGDGVSSVISVKLCEDVCHVALHGFLGNAKFACDLFVRIAGRD
jgi:hypothetical protein